VTAEKDVMVDMWTEEIGKAADVRGQAVYFADHDCNEAGFGPVTIDGVMDGCTLVVLGDVFVRTDVDQEDRDVATVTEAVDMFLLMMVEICIEEVIIGHLTDSLEDGFKKVRLYSQSKAHEELSNINRLRHSPGIIPSRSQHESKTDFQLDSPCDYFKRRTIYLYLLADGTLHDISELADRTK